MGQAAAAALAAGARRRALAKSIASTSASASGSSTSGSAGKRQNHDLKKTPSTKVTPDAKVPCGREDVMGPCQLTFEDTPGGQLVQSAHKTQIDCYHIMSIYIYIYLYGYVSK